MRSILVQHLGEMGFDASDSSIRALEHFVFELQKWNQKISLTSITKTEDMTIKHLLDSMAVIELVREERMLLDIGSGAGIPAIPLKIMLPETQVVSVDAIRKKIVFQRHVVRLLGLQGYVAMHARVENLYASHSGCFNAIVSRAFSSLQTFILLAAPLLTDGGRLIAMKGPTVDDEILCSSEFLQRSGFRVSSIQTYFLPNNMGERRLVILSAARAR